MASKYCPLIKEDCIEHRCKFYIHVQGQDPQTSKTVDHWDCAVAWMPTILLDSSAKIQQTNASIQSFRNEVIKLVGGAISMAKIAVQRKLDAR